MQHRVDCFCESCMDIFNLDCDPEFAECDACGKFSDDVEPGRTPHGEGAFCDECRCGVVV